MIHCDIKCYVVIGYPYLWFNSIGKKPNVKADLAIYGQVLDIAR